MVEAHKHTPLINSEHFHSLLVSLQTEHRSSRPGCHPGAPAGSFTLSELTQLQPCTETRGTFRHLNYLVVPKRPLYSTQHYNVMAPTLKALYAKKTLTLKKEKHNILERWPVSAPCCSVALCLSISVYLSNCWRQKVDVCSRDV